MQKRILSIVLLFSILSLAAAQSLHTKRLDNEGLAIPSESKLQIASWYAPVLWFYKDPLWEEPFTLVEADYFINISQEDNSGNYKLSQDGYAGAKTLQSTYDGIQNPVYVRVTTDEYDQEEYIVIQYWFCYLYNYGGALSVFNINHEGEWEMIEVILPYSESILNGTYPEPHIVAYSRHSGGEAHRWENEWIERKEVNGYHPIAYIAYGTHAPYFQDLGWNEDLNKGFDVSYADMNFILIEDKEWLNFSGRWGGQENSPFGPMFQEIKWESPVMWGMEYLDTYQFHLERPGHLLITNGEGNRIGFVGGEFVNEIHNSYAIITENHEYYSVPEDDYSVEISSSEEGDVDFDVIVNDNGEATLITYEHELAKHITKIYTEISSDLKEYVLKMDEDGDGKIDLTLKPDETIHYLNKKEYSLLLLAAAAVLVVVAAFAVYRIWRRKRISKDRKRTKKEWVKNILERIAAAFFLLWIVVAVTDLLVKYKVEFLQCAVGIYLISQILSVFEPQYTPGKKIQKFFTSLGWPLIGFWALFVVLEWSRWVGTVEIGIDIDYFLVIGVIFLVLGYTIAFFRSIARFGIVRFLLFAIGGFSFSFWIFTKIFSIFSEYADFILVVGIVGIGLGLVLGLKRPGKMKESPREEEEAPSEKKVEH